MSEMGRCTVCAEMEMLPCSSDEARSSDVILVLLQEDQLNPQSVSGIQIGSLVDTSVKHLDEISNGGSKQWWYEIGKEKGVRSRD